MPLSPRKRILAALGVAALGLLGPAVADACGSFFRSKRASSEQTPSLAREKVLLIHDAELGRQHFVREVAFVRAREPFGFVVPTPTKPEVAEVKTTPFTKLRALFPFSPSSRGPQARSGRGAGGSAGVEVLEVAKVGSFTAFVLAATDADALGKWLAKNKLVSDEASDAWLAHYVEMGFFYVAMRYDPPARPKPGSSREVVAETLRISFDTPIPYYPYLEPLRGEPTRELEPTQSRLLELWYVGAEPVVPVALREREGASAWVQPLRRGLVTSDARVRLEDALAPELEELLPAGPLLVQTFEDQKRDRGGFGDVLFAFEQGRALTPELAAELEPLLGILDPALIKTQEQDQ
ncbi:MAG: DUF2330 domain-containing protein [Enhygromyxa sp.]